MKRICPALVAIGFVSLFWADDGHAIPAFARKYQTSCQTCHIAIPKRNAFGEAFRRNGYVMPKGDVQLVKEEPVSLGAEAWKELWPNAIWPGLLPAHFPLAALVHQRVTYEPRNPKGQRVGFDMPHELELLFGTSFGTELGVFGSWVIYDEGENETALEKFFFQFNDVVGPKDAVNVKVGLLEPGITSGYMEANSLTLDRPITIDYRATGDWSPADVQAGIELNGILGSRFEYAAGVVNGEGKTTPSKDRKDVFARVAFKTGGLGLDGKGAEAELKQADNWRDDAVTIGVYAYTGHVAKSEATTSQVIETTGSGGDPTKFNIASTRTTTEWDHNFDRFGFDLRAGYNRFELTGGLIAGTDENPFGDKKELKHTAFFGEIDWLAYPWLIPIFRVNRARSELKDDERDKYWEFHPNLTILYRANIRMTIEGRFRVDNDRTIGGVTVEPTEKRAFRLLRVNTMLVF
ncbi:MAG: hypothetical protein HY304_00500 [candidate division Zixibacteria bacterium]|nr:hypothetical protein [candidate division Zixibacteria bacterium]